MRRELCMLSVSREKVEEFLDVSFAMIIGLQTLDPCKFLNVNVIPKLDDQIKKKIYMFFKFKLEASRSNYPSVFNEELKLVTPLNKDILSFIINNILNLNESSLNQCRFNPEECKVGCNGNCWCYCEGKGSRNGHYFHGESDFAVLTSLGSFISFECKNSTPENGFKQCFLYLKKR